ncbi:hypothetical protein RchiOBHm_Chr1g0374931 [Rosa chinensis]|uniref:Uncharacterized protein n=1 Tax=Rosa chinensis TaxID=74649 RepID=A0A2P6SMI8_ROSCH|nr:hypothetical protein RchiOBHm_Chr1g0374931 [Rosa chinensis]
MFIGFVVWVLEHRINDDFRASSRHKHFVLPLNNGLYTSLVDCGDRLGICCASTGSKTQSYGASLSSILTVPRLKPTYFEINELVKIRDYVGYPKGYFLCDLLIQSGFDDSKIEPYISREECDQLLTKGSANGGIAAAIDETPNLKLVLAFTSCTGCSRSILTVTEGDEMKNIENKWFGEATHLLR